MKAEILHWVCSVPVGITLAITGLFGNVVSIKIWFQLCQSKLRRNKSTAFYFIWLAVSDIALLTFFLLYDSFPTALPAIKTSYYFGVLWSWFLFPMFFFSLVASIWMVVGITINRFIMIAFPAKAQVVYSQTRTKLGIFAVFLFAFLVNLPHFFTFKVMKDDNSTVSEDSVAYRIVPTEFGASENSINYEFWAHCIVLVLTPWFIIMTLNMSIICKLKRQIRKFSNGKELTKQMRQEQQMTRTLLFITFTFLVMLAWQCVTQCFWMLGYGKEHRNQNVWNTVDKSFAFAKLGVVLNSSTNWIFYCFTCSMFRKAIRNMFGLSKKNHSLNINGSFDDSSTAMSTSTTTPALSSDIVISNTNV